MNYGRPHQCGLFCFVVIVICCFTTEQSFSCYYHAVALPRNYVHRIYEYLSSANFCFVLAKIADRVNSTTNNC